MPYSIASRSVLATALLAGSLLLVGLVWSVPGLSQPIAQAEVLSGVVGDGTPGSCTDTTLSTALLGGGTVTFNCGPSPKTITLIDQKTIAANTTIDGGGRITLSGGNTNRIFLVTSARLTLVGLTLTSGRSTTFGGCIYSSGGILEASGTTITGCSATGVTGRGGGVYAVGGTVSMTDSYVLNNSSDAYGGGLYLFNGTTALTNVSIAGNSVFTNGGGVYIAYGKASLNNVSILSNMAYTDSYGSGGGLYITATAQVTITNGQVSDNHIGYMGQGGGIFAYNSNTKLFDTSVNGNVALNAADGGGLYVERGSVRLTGGTANGNHGLYGGGGLSLNGTRADLDGTTLDGNLVSSNGGGFNAFQSTVVLTDVVISNNIADSDGAGVDCYECTGGFTRVTIAGNTGALRDGGGLNAYRTTLAIVDSTIRNNANLEGGGVYANESTLTLDGVTINNNTAASGGGGGLFLETGIANFTNSTLSANAAPTGGALYNEGRGLSGKMTLLNVTLKDNSATDGGGIFNANNAYTAIYVTNTILADSPSGGNCKGKAMTSSKYSISSDGTCALAGTGDHNSLAANLTFLANNGGSTKTHLPKTTSHAVDGVVGSDCPSVDQRNVARPQGLSCDVGSVERAPADPALPAAIFLPLVTRGN
jgi:hypothetical protein